MESQEDEGIVLTGRSYDGDRNDYQQARHKEKGECTQGEPLDALC